MNEVYLQCLEIYDKGKDNINVSEVDNKVLEYESYCIEVLKPMYNTQQK